MTNRYDVRRWPVWAHGGDLLPRKSVISVFLAVTSLLRCYRVQRVSGFCHPTANRLGTLTESIGRFVSGWKKHASKQQPVTVWIQGLKGIQRVQWPGLRHLLRPQTSIEASNPKVQGKYWPIEQNLLNETRWGLRQQTSPPAPPLDELDETYASYLTLPYSVHYMKTWRHPTMCIVL